MGHPGGGGGIVPVGQLNKENKSISNDGKIIKLHIKPGSDKVRVEAKFVINE